MIQKPTYEELEQRVQEMAQAESQRKRAEKKLQVSELWMRSIFNSLEEGVFVVSPERKLTNVNEAAERIFGYSKGELANQSTELLHIDQKHYVEFGRLINEAFYRNEVANFEFEAKRKNGEVFPTEHTVSVLKNDSGETIGIVSIVRDISERKLAEEDLKESRQQLELVLQGSQLGFWDWNIETGKVQRNERWAEMLGYSIQEIEFTVNQWTDLIHADDREAAWNSIQNHLEGRTSEHELEYRMLCKDGKYKWILDRAMIVSRDPQGRPLRMSGTHLDITERKQAEEEREKLINELQNALAQVKTLRGLVPICSHCKNIRDDKGYWNKIENYIHQHSDAEFSHSVCPECVKKYYPNLEIYDD